MKHLYLTFLFIYLTSNSIIAQCDEYKTQNAKLIADKSELQKKLDEEEIAYDKLHLKYMKEVEERKRFERLYYQEKRKREKLEEDLRKLRGEYETIKAERDKLRYEIKALKDADLTNNKEYKDKIIAVQHLNEELNKMESRKDEFENQSKEGEAAVNALEAKISELENEANDKISVSQKKIFFNGKWFDYGQEIVFIRFDEGSTNKMEIKPEDEYYLRRISKLASKYDFRVKISLVGESSNNDETKRKELATERVNKVKSTMILNYDLNAVDFEKNKISKEKSRIGVSIRIEKK